MFSRSLRRALAQLPPSPTTTNLPPTFLLPLRAHLTTSTTTPSPSPAPPPPPTPQPLGGQIHPQLSTSTPLPQPTHANLHLLPLLAAQPPHYIQTHIHARPYLLTMGDTLRLPFLMAHATPGAIIRLNRASMLGSRDYTYRGDPWVDEGKFLLRAVVVAVEGEPLRVMEKTTRRNRRVRRVKSKGRYTILRVTELRVLPEGSGGVVLGGEEAVGV